MRKAGWLTGTLVLAVMTAGCGGGRRYTTVTIPPRLDLGRYGRVALATFTVENAKGTLHEFATQRFGEEVLAATRNLELFEVGAVDSIRVRVGEGTFGPASAQAVASSRDVEAVFAGHLKVSDASPRGTVAGFLPRLEATIMVELTVGLYSKSGGTIWRSSATATDKVGQISFTGGEPSFSAKDPKAAYGRLVNSLVNVVVRDLYPTYEQHRVR